MKNRYSYLLSLGSAAAFILLCEFIVPKPAPLKFSGAMQALQFWNAQRAYPEKQIDDRLFSTAFEKVRFEKAAGQQLTGATDQWKEIGPHNISGRTLAVAVNPYNSGTIYAGSASGGLWRSFTKGKGANAWQRIPTGFPVLGVSSIALAPHDSNTIIIGTGEVYNQFSSVGGVTIRTTRGSYGVGILRTTDNGVTWTKTLDWNQGNLRGVQAVKFHPQYPRFVWAATTEGIYKSADTGKTWVNVSPIAMGTDLVFDPDDSLTVIAAHGNLGSTGAGIYRTFDGGKTWNQLTAGLPSPFGGKIVFTQYQSSPNIIFASIGNGAVSGTWLCKSTNYGTSWTTVSTFDYASYQGWYSHFVGVDPSNVMNVICGGVDLYKSVNGGTTLTKKSDWSAHYFGQIAVGGPEGPSNYSHADHHAIAYDPNNSNTIYFGNDGGVFCSTDGGETFEGRNGGYQSSQFYNGFSSAWLDSTVAIGGMQDNATAIYSGTTAWFRAIGGDGCMTAMSPTSSDTMYGSSQSLNIRRSSNRGLSFFSMSIPSGNITGFVGPFALAESNPKILYAGRDKVYKTTNSGVNWNAVNGNIALDGNPVLAITVSPKSADTVYLTTAPVYSRGRMYRSTNGGTSWTNITATLPDRYLIDIAVHPSDPSIVYVTASGFGTSHLYRSSNAGASWYAAGNGLPDVPTSAVAIDPFNTEHVYVGNDLGVYVSTNSGGSWASFNHGLFDAVLVMDLSVSRKNRALRAVTHGNGVYERKLLDGVTGVNEEHMITKNFSLEQNYPNPFNPVTTIEFSIPEHLPSFKNLASVDILLTVYDNTGKEIATLVNEKRSPGTYAVRFNAASLPSGTYFYRLQSGSNVTTRKMILLK